MKRPRIQHVSIPRPPGSHAQTRAFYGELLGLQEKPVPASIQHLDLIWYNIGEDMELHLFTEEPLEDRSGRHFCMEVDDVQAMRERLASAGYEPRDTIAINNRPRFFCRDPFGNDIEFTTILGSYE
ncbi:MAG TPA: VOC family protein [Roseiflexaceae bacterium]|nr:VOC family protein [Roseiflexaceae bacterium]